MRREIIATRRAGVTTSVVTEIAPKGVHRMLAHDWQDGHTRFDTHKKIRSSWANANKKLSNFEKLELPPKTRYGSYEPYRVFECFGQN